MSGSTPHAAAGQALGYMYQAQWALVELVQREMTSSDTLLRLETLDDIEIVEDAQGDPTTTLAQVKHHVTPAADFTVNSVDLWRTLNVWMDFLSSGTLSKSPVLKLVTTASIPDDSILNNLRADGPKRNVQSALGALEKSAQDSHNATTAPWRTKFMRMNRNERQALVNLIYIDDGAPRAREIADALKKSLNFSAPHGHKDTFIEYLLGWWYEICIRLLDRTIDAVTADDLDVKISDLRDQFLPDNLPMAPAIIASFTEADAVPYRDRQFVQQLLWIALDEERLWRAIRDYHRAWAQRSEWLRLNLISEPELDRFAFNLYDEWDYIFQQRIAKLRREGQPADHLAGQEILEIVSAESRARVRSRFDAGWLNRGTLHALADGWSNRTIGWHPEFPSKLTELLAGVTQ